MWHPYTAMDEFAAKDPLVVTRASACRLYDADGRSYLDGNSSWFVATLGHAHPRLVARVQQQVAGSGIGADPSGSRGVASTLPRLLPAFAYKSITTVKQLQAFRAQNRPRRADRERLASFP